MSKITMKNISSATVVVSVPDSRFRRELVPGRVITLTKAEYDDLAFEPGVQNLVSGGYIRFDGVEENQAQFEEPTTFDTSEIKKMLSEHDVTKFAQFIPTAPAAAKEAIVQEAVAQDITDSAFTALIKKYCGVDVIEAIHRKHQLED